MPIQACKDHKGNEYRSIAEMCRFYKVDRSVFGDRIKNGFTLEEALTTKGNRHYVPSVDHLGQQFPSENAMCRHWRIKHNTYQRRIKEGWTKKEALTTPAVSTTQEVKDHLGNVYPHKTAMCENYGVERTVYNTRIKKGWTVEEALTTPMQSRNLEDIPNRVGIIKRMSCGLDLEILSVDGYDTYTARFEDGHITKCKWADFEKGYVKHKSLSKIKNGEYMGYKVSFITEMNGDVYYSCENIETGEKEVLTPQEMIRGKEGV